MYFSPAYLSQYRITLPLIQKFASGKLIDVGCGDTPFRDYISDRISDYDSLDLYPRRPDITYKADIQDMAIIGDETYDSALCLEVLEHVPDPLKALTEIYRILKIGGVLILSVPHLSRLHDEPADYYRFTKYGLRHMLEHTGFRIVALEHRGGLLSFLGHQIATFWLAAFWRVPILKYFVWHLNAWLVTRFLFAVDQFVNPEGIFAMGYSVVAKKDS